MNNNPVASNTVPLLDQYLPEPDRRAPIRHGLLHEAGTQPRRAAALEVIDAAGRHVAPCGLVAGAGQIEAAHALVAPDRRRHELDAAVEVSAPVLAQRAPAI